MIDDFEIVDMMEKVYQMLSFKDRKKLHQQIIPRFLEGAAP